MPPACKGWVLSLPLSLGTYLAVCLHSCPSAVLKSSESCINSMGQFASSFFSSCLRISLTLSAAEDVLELKILLQTAWQMTTEFMLEGARSALLQLLFVSDWEIKSPVISVRQSPVAPIRLVSNILRLGPTALPSAHCFWASHSSLCQAVWPQ